MDTNKTLIDFKLCVGAPAVTPLAARLRTHKAIWSVFEGTEHVYFRLISGGWGLIGLARDCDHKGLMDAERQPYLECLSTWGSRTAQNGGPR